jgi:hypothetical protein
LINLAYGGPKIRRHRHDGKIHRPFAEILIPEV